MKRAAENTASRAKPQRGIRAIGWWLVGAVAAMTVLLALPCPLAAAAQPKKAPEYEIKSAYLYNFLLFVDWPESTPAHSGPDTITIGIVGDDPFGKHFAGVEGKTIEAKGKRLVIKRFGRFRAGMDLKQCQLLFIARSEKDRVGRILNAVGAAPVLTVSEVDGFLDAGGMINLVVKRSKVLLKIDLDPVTRAGLAMRAQLIRIAEEVRSKGAGGP